MADENMNKSSILSMVQGEMHKAKRDAVKAAVKAKYADLLKAQQAVSAIEDAIIADLTSIGEDEAGIRAILAGE